MPPTQFQFRNAARDFSPRVNFQCRLLYGVCAPPCAVACIYICEHAKDPVVHVRVWWFMETLKHPACTLGWVAQLCCSGFPLERQPKFPMGIIPLGQYNCKKFIEKNVKVIWGLKANCLALDLGLAGIILIVCIRSELTVLLSRHSVGTYRGNKLMHNLSGNIQPQSSQVAGPLWTDPGLKSGISVHELIST